MTRTRTTAGLVALAVGAAVLVAAIAGSGNSTRGRASGPFGWLQPRTPPLGPQAATLERAISSFVP
jgi:hypothetical protein